MAAFLFFDDIFLRRLNIGEWGAGKVRNQNKLRKAGESKRIIRKIRDFLRLSAFFLPSFSDLISDFPAFLRSDGGRAYF
jgi:hypothetical protein